MKKSLQDSVIIVTGGGRGIGLSYCTALAEEGAKIIIAEKNAKNMEKVQENFKKGNNKVEFIQTDVTDRKQVKDMCFYVMKKYKYINALINNAAIHEMAPFLEETEDLWLRLYKINVLGTVIPTQAVLPYMLKHGSGSIINISSKAAVVGEPGHVAYSASKGAVLSMTRAMAIDFAYYGIRVNCICPGPVETEMFRKVVSKEEQELFVSEIPLGRIGQPEDIAGIAVYLASDRSKWCTGQIFCIDGGMSILK